MENAIQPIITQLAEGHDLSAGDAARAFQIIMNGGATPAQIAAILMGLRLKGETAEEITGAAEAMRAKSQPFSAPEGAIDTCGTGGDARGTFNVSTAVAIVLAGCGVPVVKHGNRSVSSRCGSADVLEHLGVKIDAEREVMERALKASNLCFLLAPRYHPAMRHVAPVRQELGVRTIFNLLGPLSNPARVKYQLLGVYDRNWVEPIAYVLRDLGLESACVVHGHDGVDELSITGPSLVALLKNDEVHSFEVTPEEAGLPRAKLSDLEGGDVATNAKIIENLLQGQKNPCRDVVLLNAAAALIVRGLADDLPAGVAKAASAIDDGHAFTALQKLVHLSREAPVKQAG